MGGETAEHPSVRQDSISPQISSGTSPPPVSLQESFNSDEIFDECYSKASIPVKVFFFFKAINFILSFSRKFMADGIQLIFFLQAAGRKSVRHPKSRSSKEIAAEHPSSVRQDSISLEKPVNAFEIAGSSSDSFRV